MPTCSWTLLCRDATEPEKGSIDADDNAQFVIAFDDRGKLMVAGDDNGQTVTIEGDVTLRKVGAADIRFVAGAALDPSGVTGLSGKPVFDFSKNVTFDVTGQLDPQTGEMQAGGMLTVRF